ncbi:MurR/RpiR family transcriptional regulator [Glaciecola siphonariae]|uniref:MurR/RpiR family transcriptional regulator n=1 Tax=Glaciecola siphonariae TaxID=521012 RepID=A0ABV9M1G4_9ALTE
MDVVNSIKEGLRHFSPAEKKVAQFILRDLNFAANATINELAKSADVSHATITRLAKSVHCANVREFKLKIAQSAAIGERFTNEETVEKHDISHVYQSISDILLLNSGLIQAEVVQGASEAICAAKHCLVFGVGGGSSMMAQECTNRFFRLGIASNSYSDPMMMRMTAATVDKSDVVICLSLSGISADVFSSMRIAKEYGACIVAVCPQGELADYADFHLPIKTQESDYIFKPSASRYVMLAAIDILSSELAVINQRKSREKLRRIKIQLDYHREQSGMQSTSNRLPLGD